MMNQRAARSFLSIWKRDDSENPIDLPAELVRAICEFGRDNLIFKHVAEGKCKEVKLILDEALARKDAHAEIKALELKALLSSLGDAITPAGVIVQSATLLGCALGSGDPEMIALIKSYFSHFEGGAAEMERQMAPYRAAILAGPTQEPDDLTWLIPFFKAASKRDVQEELKIGDEYDWTYESDLRRAMNRFREMKLTVEKRTIKGPGMHYNPANLQYAYYLLWEKEWDTLKGAEGADDEYDKLDLFARQVIGFIQLVELPAHIRFVFARGQADVAIVGGEIERLVTYKYNNPGGDSFPYFAASLIKLRVGVGFDSFVSIFGSWRGRLCGVGGHVDRTLFVRAGRFSELMSSNNTKLADNYAAAAAQVQAETDPRLRNRVR